MSARSLYFPNFEEVRAYYREQCEIRPGLPQSEVYEQVLYVPGSRDGQGGPPAWTGQALGGGYRGALFDRNEQRIAAADMAREGMRTRNDASPEPEQGRIAGTGLYLGWAFGHYGHALLESLSRCWRVGEFDFALYHVPGKRIPSYLEAHVDRLGIPTLIFPNRPTRFERLIVPRQAFELDVCAYRGFPDSLRRSGTRKEKDARPVYISRSRLPADRRGVVGEEMLEPFLSGYRVVHPEKLSVREQVELFEVHTSFAGALGSAMHGILFSRAPEVIYLAAWRPLKAYVNYMMCDELVEADSLYVFCCDLGDMPERGLSTPLRLDLARAAEALKVSVDPKLQNVVDARHREAWAEFRLKQGIVAGDRSALADVGRHYSGEMTVELSRLAQELEQGGDEPDSDANGGSGRTYSRRQSSRWWRSFSRRSRG